MSDKIEFAVRRTRTVVEEVIVDAVSGREARELAAKSKDWEELNSWTTDVEVYECK